ncbi:hypothetical protein, partial [Mesorhizobium amorphae]|uniref:hypothetical protein n=1 Tax=Mesorhizobium amorphae TaxID=71433 RepID=UPI0024E10ACD
GGLPIRALACPPEASAMPKSNVRPSRGYFGQAAWAFFTAPTIFFGPESNAFWPEGNVFGPGSIVCILGLRFNFE